MKQVYLTWLFLQAIYLNCLESKSLHLNELLATKINDLPEEMIATFKLFLADPASFSRQVISNAKVGRNKRSSDDCNIDYSSESVGLDVKITCVDPKIPLKNGRALVVFDKLEAWMETKFKLAAFNISFTFPEYTNDFSVSILYKFERDYVTEEEGSFIMKRSSNKRIVMEHKILYSYTATQTLPSFSFTINPSYPTTPLPACNHILDLRKCTQKADLEFVADKDTWLTGDFDWGSHKYKIRIQNTGDTPSERRKNSERYNEFRSYMNPKANGVIRGNGLIHDVLFGYSKKNLQFTGVLAYDDSIPTKDYYFLQINLNPTKSTVKAGYKDQIIKTGFDLSNQTALKIYYENNRTSDIQKYIDINLNYENYKIDSILKPSKFPWMCNIFRFCEDYKTEGELNIANFQQLQASIEFSHKRGNTDLFKITGTSMENLIFLRIQSHKYLPSFLTEDGDLFELEITNDGSQYMVSKSTRDDLKAWKAENNKLDNNDWDIFYKDYLLFTYQGGKDIVFSTKTFYNIEVTTMILTGEKGIEVKTKKVENNNEISYQTDKLEWDIGLSDGLLKYSNEGSNKAFKKFLITKKMRFNTNDDYMALNSVTKFDKETEMKVFRIKKFPKFNVFIDY